MSSDALRENDKIERMLYWERVKGRGIVVRIVVKIDDSTLTTSEKIEQITNKLIRKKQNGDQLVVVVPAIERFEERLHTYHEIISNNPYKREAFALDGLQSQLASSLLAISFLKKEVPAISLTGWQSGVQVEEKNDNVLIKDVETERIEEHLRKGEIVIVAGSQGIDQNQNLLSLGEGGNETTAVAIGHRIGAAYVEILTVQDGVYTANPHVIQEARKLKQITYDEMLELAHLGSTFIHPRAVELAKTYEISLKVSSSTEEVEGTLIKGEVDMEKNLIVRGVAWESDIIRLTVGYDQFEQALLANIFTTLAEHRINVDIIVQTMIDGVKPTVSFSIAKEDFAEAIKVLEKYKSDLGFSFADFEVGLAKVSIVGAGMVTNPGVAARMFNRLHKENIVVKMVSTSEIKVSVVVPQDEMVRAAQVLHDEFNLVEEKN